jgi:hypothetical protein
MFLVVIYSISSITNLKNLKQEIGNRKWKREVRNRK